MYQKICQSYLFLTFIGKTMRYASPSLTNEVEIMKEKWKRRGFSEWAWNWYVPVAVDM